MIVLQANNRYVHIKGASMEILSKLDAISSYYVSGAHFALSYRKGWWDGRVHLLALHSPSGQYRVPIGMLEDIQQKLDALGVQHMTLYEQRQPHTNVDYRWNPEKTLRPYQNKAVNNVVEHKLKSGILKLPIRSGKTRVAGRIIHDLKVKTLFLVPDKMLLYQTQKALADVLCLDIDEVGIIGDNQWTERDVTVASIMTLVSRRGSKRECKGNASKNKLCVCGREKCDGGNEYKIPRDPKYNSLVQAYDLVIFDECFPAGTLVDGKPIEQIKVGDSIVSYGEHTVAQSMQRVSHVFKKRPMRLLRIKAGQNELICTPNHPLLTNSGWVIAGEVERGMHLVRCSSEYDGIQHLETARVDNIEILQPGSDGTYAGLCPDGYVYNLEVENTHTYTANGFIVHNCHHLRGEEWRKVMMDIDAPYRLGLSATVYLDLKTECERGVIWLKACCGNIRASISTSKLIELGYLVRPKILLYKVSEPDAHDVGWHSKLLRDTVFENEQRNQKIANVAAKLVGQGMRVMVVTRRLKQAALIGRAIKKLGISIAIMIGDTKKDQRDDRVEGFKDGSIQVLIGTVFKEGVDIPEVEAVINAEGGKDVKVTVQRMRNLTPHEGKNEAIFVDFIDATNPYTAQHSLDRLKTYRAERAFDIRIMDE